MNIGSGDATQVSEKIVLMSTVSKYRSLFQLRLSELWKHEPLLAVLLAVVVGCVLRGGSAAGKSSYSCDHSHHIFTLSKAFVWKVPSIPFSSFIRS